MPWNRWNMHPCHGFWWHDIHMPCGDICVMLVWATWDDMLWQHAICHMRMWQFHRSLQAQMKQWTMLFWAHQKLVKVAPLAFLSPFPPFDASSLRVDVECKHHKGMTSSTFGYPIFWTQTNLRYMFRWLGGYFQLGPQLYYILYNTYNVWIIYLYII